MNDSNTDKDAAEFAAEAAAVPLPAAAGNTELASRFTRVYSSNQWLDPESISGPGSRLDSDPVKEALAILKDVCEQHDIVSLIDIPCGDLNWLSKFLIDRPLLNYKGFDIVQPLIERNRRTFPHIDCEVLDITTQVPPAADLVLCKDLIIHLNDEDIRHTLFNIKASGSKFLLVSNNFGMPNSDLRENIHGDSACRYVDITTKPFGCSPPLWRSNYLGLWRLSDMALV